MRAKRLPLSSAGGAAIWRGYQRGLRLLDDWTLSTMKNQRTETAMTVARFTDMVVCSVFRRDGDLSTHRPTLDERHIDAPVLMIPLEVGCS